MQTERGQRSERNGEENREWDPHSREWFFFLPFIGGYTHSLNMSKKTGQNIRPQEQQNTVIFISAEAKMHCEELVIIIKLSSSLPLGFEQCKAAHGSLAHYHSHLQSGCLLCLWPPEGGHSFVNQFKRQFHTLDRELQSLEICISHTKPRLRVKENRTSVSQITPRGE